LLSRNELNVDRDLTRTLSLVGLNARRATMENTTFG